VTECPASDATISRDRYSASRIAKELGELLENPSYAAKAKEVGHIIQGENGGGAACDAIETQLKTGGVL
jgi:UDP:flavonoid glycosyltransferase YjiC (YdhE family)